MLFIICGKIYTVNTHIYTYINIHTLKYIFIYMVKGIIKIYGESLFDFS